MREGVCVCTYAVVAAFRQQLRRKVPLTKFPGDRRQRDATAAAAAPEDMGGKMEEWPTILFGKDGGNGSYSCR